MTEAERTSGVRRIHDERFRQIVEEGYTAEHDQGHGTELIRAAKCYTMVALLQSSGTLFSKNIPPFAWPWANEYWKPSDDPIRNLEKAGALIAAAIDSLQAERDETSEASEA